MTLALYGKTRQRRMGLLLGGLLAVIVAVSSGLLVLPTNSRADSSPPVLVSLTVAPQTVDVSASPQDISVTAHITDSDGAGTWLMSSAPSSLTFFSPSGTQTASVFFDGTFPTMGDSHDGQYTRVVTIPAFAEPGVWAAGVFLIDNLGNATSVDATTLALLGLPASVTVIDSSPDSAAPQLVAFDFLPKQVDVSSSPKTVSFTAHITDDKSGAGAGLGSPTQLELQSPSGSETMYVTFDAQTQLVSGTPQDGFYLSTLTVPAHAQSGQWTLTRFLLIDEVGNRAELNTAQMVVNEFPTVLTVAELGENVSIQVHKYLPKDNVNNPWENQGSSAGSWKFTVYADNGGSPGAVLVADLDDLTPSAGFPQQDILVKETNTDGDVFFGWFKPDGDGENSGNDKCNQAPADFTTGGKYSRAEYLPIPAAAFGTPGNLTGLLHICAYDKPAPPPTHTVQVCKVVEQNNDGVDQGGSFSGEIRHWTAAASFTAVPWSVSGVVEGGEPVCTTVSTIPSDHSFSIVEFGFRPGAWVADATAYPWYEDNKGMTHSANGTTINYTADVKVTFHNKSTAATRNVQVCKVVVGNGDGDVTGAFSYGFDIRPAGGATIQGSNSAAEPSPDTAGANGAEVCKTKQVPSDRAFDVVEWMSRPSGWTEAAGYPKYALNDSAQVSNNTTTTIAAGSSDVKVTFYNKDMARSVQVCKVAVGNGDGISVAAFGYGFDIRPSGIGNISGSNSVAEPNPDTDDSQTAEACSTRLVPANKSFDVVEWMSRPTGWIGDAAGYPKYQIDGGALFSNNTTTPVAAGTSDVKVTFFNKELRRTGTIEIVKNDVTTAGNVDRPADGDWDFAVTGPGGFSKTASIPFGGGKATITDVPLGSGYAVTETDGRHGQCSTESNPTGQGYETTNIEDGPLALTAAGDTITFVFRNEDCGIVFGTGQLHVWKVRDILGDGMKNGPDANVAWNVTITGPEFPSGQNFTVPATGLHLSGLTEGLYTISEATQVGWKTIGVIRSESPAIVVSASTQVSLNNDDDDTVTFFNQPLGDISVHKEAFRSHNGGQNTPAPQDDDGWTITLTSATCKVTRQAATDEQGNALFSGLPLCTDYVVTESDTNADSPGFVPLTASRLTNITPNGFTLTFNNILRTSDPFIVVTPVPTTPPTATPVPPTATVVPPTTPPTQPPPPATAIAGEKTPGPGQPTPIVPSTGNTGMGGTGANLMIFAAGLFAVATVFGAAALAQRRRR